MNIRTIICCFCTIHYIIQFVLFCDIPNNISTPEFAEYATIKKLQFLIRKKNVGKNRSYNVCGQADRPTEVSITPLHVL